MRDRKPQSHKSHVFDFYSAVMHSRDSCGHGIYRQQDGKIGKLLLDSPMWKI